MSALTGLENEIYQLVSSELTRRGLYSGKLRYVPIGVTLRHLHIQKEHFEALFGKGAQLTVYRMLSQPGQFASNEKVTLSGPKGTITDVRILGPFRKQTQVEASVSDTRKLGVNAPVRASGDLKGSAGITLIGPHGQLRLNEGLILMERHIHMTPQQAEASGYRNGQKVSLRASGVKGGTLEHVNIRVSADYALDTHIDMDEANALGIVCGDLMEIIEVE